MQAQERKTLADMLTGDRCIILKVHGHGGFRHRILELGFVRGEEVSVLKSAPLMDPVEYQIMGSHVSLRQSEARNIEVVSLSEEAHPDNLYHGTIEEHVRAEVEELSKTITVALVGNPNCGKTSFFNLATGLHEKVGNYSGVTVAGKTGVFEHRGYTINLVDLPGTYSLADYTPEELYVRDFLATEHPDVVLNLVDSGNLERNLFLTTQLIDRNPRMVLALNMYDELEKSGAMLDYKALSRMLGFPVVPLIANTGWGIENVLEQIVCVYENNETCTNHEGGCLKHIHINYGEQVEEAIGQIKTKLLASGYADVTYPLRYIALRLLENDHREMENLRSAGNTDDIIVLTHALRASIEKEYKDDIASVISGLKYGFVRGALSETLSETEKDKEMLAYSLDKVLTNRWLGMPVLVVFMFLMFQATFTLGAYPQEWLELGVEALKSWVGSLMPNGMLRDLLLDGVISGVGGVLVFLPNILILFLFISVLEDSGYMARAAFIMDKLMHKMGLHGKSFIPYIIGFGCSVPAVMATRTLENRKDRMLTMLTVPFMSCSARLPIYMLLVSAFSSEYQALILLGLYVLGVVVAVLTSLFLNKVVFKSQSDQFVMELPPYRIPTLRNTLVHMWDKGKQYLHKMGSVILLASIIIWALSYFPLQESGAGSNMEESYIGQVGKALAPIVEPIGSTWHEAVALLTGFAAKEIVVSSLQILYDGDILVHSSLNPLSSLSLMIFILLYAPCVATVVAIGKESNWRWALFSVGYNTIVAWLLAFVVYQVGGWLGF